MARGESLNGGRGPFIDSHPEVFDTAPVVIALSRFVAYRDEIGDGDTLYAMMLRGRDFLLRE